MKTSPSSYSRPIHLPHLYTAPYSLLPQPLATTTLLSIPMNLTTPGPSYEWNHRVSVLLWLSILSSRFIPIAGVRFHFLYKAGIILLYVHNTFCLSIHLPMHTWGFFHPLVILSNVAMNMGIKIFLWVSTSNFWGYIPRSGIAILFLIYWGATTHIICFL